MRSRFMFLFFCAAGVAAALVATGAGAHTSGCHSAHSCPSDHHTYVWYDANSQGWDCAKAGATEYDPSRDTTTITYDGYTYYCRAAGSAPPPSTTPTETTPASTTPTTTEPASAPTPVAENDGDAAGGTCGIERWSVKTMSDAAARRISLHPHRSSVRALRGLPAPHVGKQTQRMRGAERTVYRIRARLVEMKTEDDSDIHVVIADPSNARRTMIVEFRPRLARRARPGPRDSRCRRRGGRWSRRAASRRPRPSMTSAARRRSPESDSSMFGTARRDLHRTASSCTRCSDSARLAASQRAVPRPCARRSPSRANR